MDHTGYEHLLIERRGALLQVALNAPDKLNAIDFAMESELLRLFQDLRRDRSTAVVVLTGSGRAFSAGGDLQHNLRLLGDLPMIRQEFDLARRFVNTLLSPVLVQQVTKVGDVEMERDTLRAKAWNCLTDGDIYLVEEV